MYKSKSAYKNIFESITSHLSRGGWKEVLDISSNVILSLPIFYIISKFTYLPFRILYSGKKLKYFSHKYNTTWLNERALEISIATDFIQQFSKDARVLEIGNVFSHYQQSNHTVLDKFEVAKGVINKDIIDYNPTNKFDGIFSISTFEHIGFDDSIKKGERVLMAFNHLDSLLKPDSKALITFPLGYNNSLDEYFFSGKIAYTRCTLFAKQPLLNLWKECSRDFAEVNYKKKFRDRTRILAVIEIEK